MSADTAELTPWFPMTTPPVRDGVYSVKSHAVRAVGFARWGCGQWHLVRPIADQAAFSCERSDDCYDGYITGWRGLTYLGAS